MLPNFTSQSSSFWKILLKIQTAFEMVSQHLVEQYCFLRNYISSLPLLQQMNWAKGVTRKKDSKKFRVFRKVDDKFKCWSKGIWKTEDNTCEITQAGFIEAIQISDATNEKLYADGEIDEKKYLSNKNLFSESDLAKMTAMKISRHTGVFYSNGTWYAEIASDKKQLKAFFPQTKYGTELEAAVNLEHYQNQRKKICNPEIYYVLSNPENSLYQKYKGLIKPEDGVEERINFCLQSGTYVSTQRDAEVKMQNVQQDARSRSRSYEEFSADEYENTDVEAYATSVYTVNCSMPSYKELVSDGRNILRQPDSKGRTSPNVLAGGSSFKSGTAFPDLAESDDEKGGEEQDPCEQYLKVEIICKGTFRAKGPFTFEMVENRISRSVLFGEDSRDRHLSNLKDILKLFCDNNVLSVRESAEGQMMYSYYV